MKKREQKKKQKRDSILEAAQALFQSSGFIGTSMDKIAANAGVTKQTVYRYFDSKEALFKATLEEQRLQVNNDFIEALNLENPVEALEGFAIGFLERHLSKAHMANIRLLVSEGPRVPEITRTFYAMGPRRTKSRLGRFFKERFNVDNAEFEVDAFLAILLSLRMPLLTGLNAPPSPAKIRRHATKAVKVLLKLLERPNGRGGP